MTIAYFAFAMRKDRSFPEEVLDFTTVLSHFNSAIDPIIYAYRIKDVRDAMKTLLTCGRIRKFPKPLQKPDVDEKNLPDVESSTKTKFQLELE